MGGARGSVVHEPSGLEPFEPRGATSRLESLGNRSLGGSWRLEQGSTSGLESLGGSSRLGQGSISRLDSTRQNQKPVPDFCHRGYWRIYIRASLISVGRDPIKEK